MDTKHVGEDNGEQPIMPEIALVFVRWSVHTISVRLRPHRSGPTLAPANIAWVTRYLLLSIERSRSFALSPARREGLSLVRFHGGHWSERTECQKYSVHAIDGMADILFAKAAVRLSVEQVLTFFLKDSPQDDLWVRMTLLLERSQNQSRR